MNRGAKPVVERLLARMRQAQSSAVRRPLREGPSTHFRRDPDRISGATDWPADDPVTPAARRMMDGETFEVDGDFYTVEDVHPSTMGAQADVLVLRGFEQVRGDERTTLRAIQVRDLETLIDEGRVEIPFFGSARQFNLQRGWCRGGRTMASLGITFGDDEKRSA